VREKYCWLVADKPSEHGAQTEFSTNSVQRGSNGGGGDSQEGCGCDAMLVFPPSCVRVRGKEAWEAKRTRSRGRPERGGVVTRTPPRPARH
jgi:hypothetical protein